ncbi:MAG: isoprenylcysteine carboxylmethyltransferase family protein [Chloroflexi bacterium]|nr:isoprenylcysteine carboxylmethyltransferase family protein [Chloroflexota bacterium]
MNNQQKTFTPRVIIQVIFFIVIIPFLPLLISWQWGWWEAWLYAVISILGFALSRGVVARKHPDLLAERARAMQHKDTKSWDKRLLPLIGLGGALIPLVAGLDALYDWSATFNLPLKIASLLIILAGYALGSYAISANRFFSGVVRIQTDRDHTVVSSGPYRWIRHPGYAGALLSYLATPIFLDAQWAFLPVIFLIIVLLIRTVLEDRTLQNQLDGYRDYAQRVRYRLLPGVW